MVFSFTNLLLFSISRRFYCYNYPFIVFCSNEMVGNGVYYFCLPPYQSLQSCQHSIIRTVRSQCLFSTLQNQFKLIQVCGPFGLSNMHTKDIQIILRLFLVIAMYCQASSSQFFSITQPLPLLACREGSLGTCSRQQFTRNNLYTI